MPQRIAVIGGGLSGLTAAYYAARFCPDAELVLYEASPRLGGVIQTERVDCEDGAFVLDHGADMFATEPPAAIELCRHLGVEDSLLVPNTDDAGALVVHRGTLVPIPNGFVLARATRLWPMLTTPLLSPLGKARFLAERFVPRSRATRADCDDAIDESVGEFVRQRMGQEVLQRLAGPLVAGIYTADVDRLSLKATLGPIASMVRRHGSLAKATGLRKRVAGDQAERGSAGARYQKFRGFPAGMADLIDALAAAIDRDTIRMQTPVAGLQWTPDGSRRWLVSTAEATDAFDHVVVATPASVAGELLETAVTSLAADPRAATACNQAATALGSIESASAAIVVLAVRKSQVARLPRQFGFVVPLIEKRNVLAVSFASHKYPVRCPATHTIIRTFVGGAMQPDLLRRNDEELISLVRGELGQLIGLVGLPTISRVVRWTKAMPQYHVGHKTLVDQIEVAMDRLPGLTLATNALHGVGIAPVVANAKHAAEIVRVGASKNPATQDASPGH